MFDRPPPCHVRGERLNPCAAAVFRQHVEQSFSLRGPWRGWRIERGKLIGPGRIVWTPDTLRLAAEWQKRKQFCVE